MQLIKRALVVSVSLYLIVVLSLLAFDRRNKKPAVLIQTRPGSVVHIEASESAIVTTTYPITFVAEPMAQIVGLANVYAGPADHYAVIGHLGDGEMRRIIQKSSDQKWLQICCVAGQVAWIAVNKIQIVGDVLGLPTYIDISATEQISK